MPPRAGSGVDYSSHDKTKYKYKWYYKNKSYPPSSSRHRRQNTSSSDPDTPSKRHQLPIRSSSYRNRYRTSQADTRPPATSKPSGRPRKPIIPKGLFGDERGNVNLDLVRRLDKDSSKEKIPKWLSQAYSDLPTNNPLRAHGSYSSPDVHQAQADDDDANPFAFQPPTPSPAPPIIPTSFPPSYSHLHAPRPRAPVRGMNLASVSSHLTPVLVEHAYQEHYQDTVIPLNDNNVPSPTYDVYKMPLPAPNFVSVPEAVHFSVSPQAVSSPLFISDIHSGSSDALQLSPMPSAFLFTSDDTTIPTPTHSAARTIEQDEAYDATRKQHSYISPVYATSPTLGGLPLNALVGSYSVSSRAQTSSPLLVPTWNNSPKSSSRTSTFQPYSDSSDIYKARLLAYATTAADQLSSSGRDEAIAFRRWGDECVANETNEDQAFDEAIPSNELDQNRLADGVTVLVQGTELRPPRDSAPLSSVSRPQSNLEPISEISPEPSNEGMRGSEKVNPISGGCFEEWEDEPIGEYPEEPGIRLFPEDEDELAVDEPLDEEPDDHSTPVLGWPTILRSDIQVEPSHATATSKGDPPMSASRRDSPNRGSFVKTENLTRLSPKFAARSARRIRPSPFGHLVKKRRSPSPNPEATTKDNGEDEIESWPG